MLVVEYREQDHDKLVEDLGEFCSGNTLVNHGI